MSQPITAGCLGPSELGGAEVHVKVGQGYMILRWILKRAWTSHSCLHLLSGRKTSYQRLKFESTKFLMLRF
jgi:hypothetical protein